MNKIVSTVAVIAAGTIATAGQPQVNVGVDDSSAAWLGFMNVSELPANGGGFVFGSGWGTADLVSNFDDGAGTLEMFPNQIGDPNEFWYQDTQGVGGENPGGPGQLGNKIMEANLYQQSDGGLAGKFVQFSGNVLSFDMTAAHDVRVFIRDFAADFSSSVDSFGDIDAAGNFSIDLNTIDDASRHVQWGIQVKGENVWSTDIDPFGSAVFATIPAPGAFAIMGLGGLVASRRRRA